MNIGLAAATFAVVIPAELPDKTFISTVVLSSRYRALPVWIGAASGLVLQALVAVLLGQLLSLLPHRAVEAIVAALFLGGACYLIAVKEKVVASEAEHDALQAEQSLERGDNVDHMASTFAATIPSALRIAATTFGIVALAEFGDLTQIVIANFTARSRDPLSVFVGAALAFVAISGIGVAAGRTLARVVPLQLVRKISGVALLALGIWSAVGAATGPG